MQELEELMARPAFSAQPEPRSPAGETVYRLHVHHEVPARLSTIVGDVVHNLRSSLDCIAFKLATRTYGPMDEDRQRAVQFPIEDTPDDFTKFFEGKRRRGLFSDVQREALRSVQPGWFHDHCVAQGDAPDASARDQEVRKSLLRTLHRLSNIDKHRKLHLLVWRPTLIYWGSDSTGRQYDWQPGAPPYDDGAVIGTLISRQPGQEAPKVFTEFELSLADHDPYQRSAGELLTQLHNHVAHVTNEVFRRAES
ncbi:hypothetical protein [Jiangella mangrovi]|uniref:Uncharacterized protein n=1 Tax=Jiangella mangrovi TaxID=1524084 RepID=A0A7W9GXA3_9ACTN|nr:hypothetical protein [Jiangella mangrovi]MBB5791763.1 hypothetical protein [Jiangella mangrovi]